MPVVGPEILVEAPPLVPPPTGLLVTLAHVGLVVEHDVPVEGPSGAPVTPEHWLAGIRFEPASIAALEKYDLCSGVTLSGANTHKAPKAGVPFALIAADTCSSWGWNEGNFTARATEALLAKEPAALEIEFERAALLPSNPHLADNTNPTFVQLNGGAATGAASALALLDEAIANANIGRGIIHATAYVFALWGAAQLLREGISPDVASSIALSPAGNLVVSGNGYLGASPANVVDASHGVQWAYATEMMVVHRAATPNIRPARLVEALERRNNSITYRANRPYAIAWGQILHAGVAVNTTPTTGSGAASSDISDRAARLLGVADVSDRAARILGVLRAPAAGDLFNAANPGNVTVAGATIAVPVDVQALYRVQSILTTAALAANGVYTSGAIDGINARRITGKVFSDVAGSLAIQQADDGVTWDTVTTIAVAAGAAVVWDQVLNARYVRYVYTNGATLQATFRLSGYLAAA